MATAAQLEDQWGSQLKECAIGEGADRVILDSLGAEVRGGRRIARHVYPHRDGADTEDMGGEERLESHRIIFFPRTGRPDAYGEFLRFVAIKDSGRPVRFTNPLTGSFLCRIEEFSFTLEPMMRDTIMVQATFVEHSTARAVFEAAEGTPLLSGVEEVESAAADVDAALEETGQESTIGDDCVTEVTAWADDDLGARDINVEVVALSNKIAAETERLEVETDIKRYPLARALHMLHGNVVRAAKSITSRTARIVEIVVDAAAPLLVICARYYGASEAQDRADQIRKLNSIRNPARIEAGTRLKAHARGTRLRLRTP